MSRGIHTMTSQCCVCVLCAVSGLQGIKIWEDTYDVYTLDKTLMHALNVRNNFHLRTPCVIICTFIQVNTSVRNVINAFSAADTCENTVEVTRERNLFCVLFVAKDSHFPTSLYDTAESTVTRNRTNVSCATRRLDSLAILPCTLESTLEQSRTSVLCVTNVLAYPVTCGGIYVVYMATVDRIFVLAAGRCSRQTVNWRVIMFVFTQVESHTRADTVQTVFHPVKNSNVICWSYTVKITVCTIRHL